MTLLGGGWDQPSHLCLTLPWTGGSKGVLGGGAFTNNLHQLVINLYPPPLNNQTSSGASFLNASLSQGHSSPTKTGQSRLPNPSSVRKLWNHKLFNLCRPLLGGLSLPLSQALSLRAFLPFSLWLPSFLVLPQPSSHLSLSISS